MTSEDKAGYEEQGIKVQPLPPPVNSMNSRRNGRPRTLPLIQYQGIIDTLARIETLLDEKTRLNAAEVRSLRAIFLQLRSLVSPAEDGNQ